MTLSQIIDHIGEALERHRLKSEREAEQRIAEIMARYSARCRAQLERL